MANRFVRGADHVWVEGRNPRVVANGQSLCAVGIVAPLLNPPYRDYRDYGGC